MSTTVSAPKPARPATKPLPAGAARWSKTWVDRDGLPHVTAHAVPVDENDRRTNHVRHVCSKGQIEVTLADGTTERRPCDQEQWLLPNERKFCPDHACAMEPTEALSGGVVPWRKLWAAAEKPARPLYALAAITAAGYGLEQQASDPLGVLAATPLATAGAWWATRTVLRKRAEKAGKVDTDQATGRRVERIDRVARAAGYSTTVAGAWLSAAAAVDPASLVGKVVWSSLPVAWAVCAAPWWRHLHALRNRPTPAEAIPEAVKPRELSDDEQAAADAARLWAEADIPNTKLDVATWKRITCGWQAVVKATKRGALNGLASDSVGTIRKIAAAFDVPKSAVTWIEEHDDNPNCALLLVQPNNPLKDGQVWPGPSAIRITDKAIESVSGTLINGEPIVDRLYVFGWGAPGEVALGTTGGGKSMRARKRLVVERWASYEAADGQRKGLFLSFLHDPKRLESYGEFYDAVHGYGITRDDAHIMVDAFLRECMRRYDAMASHVWHDVRNGKQRRRRGGIKWDPRVHGPILSVHWDEFHELAGDSEFVKKLEKLARYIRAGALRCALYSHMATIGDTGSQALRDMVAGGRSTLFRTTSGLNAGLTTGGQLTADPRALPKLPGMCLVADGETATLMGRESWIPGTEEEAAAAGTDRTLYDWLFDDDNQPIGYPAEIPAETQEAFGPEFMEWMAAGRTESGRDGWSYTGTPAFVPTAERAEEMAAPDKLLAILAKADRPLSRKEIKADPLWVNPSTGEPMNITSTMTAAIKANEQLIVKGQRGQEMTYALSDQERARRGAVEQERQMELALETDAA